MSPSPNPSDACRPGTHKPIVDAIEKEAWCGICGYGLDYELIKAQYGVWLDHK